MTAFCDEGDVVMICSDGVYDNLDPQQLNVSCRELGLDSDEWETGTNIFIHLNIVLLTIGR